MAIITWAATAQLSVPLHDRLAAGFDSEAHRSLVRTNARIWTAAWIIHSLIVLDPLAGVYS